MSLDFDTDDSVREPLRRRAVSGVYRQDASEPFVKYGELLLAERAHPTAVAAMFIVAAAIVVAGIVGSVGVAASEQCAASPSYPAQSAGVTSSVIVGLLLVALVVVFAVERSLPSMRTRVRNVVFLLSVALLLVSQWLKVAIDVVVACQPGSAYAVTNLVAVSLIVVWYVVVIWSTAITR